MLLLNNRRYFLKIIFGIIGGIFVYKGPEQNKINKRLLKILAKLPNTEELTSGEKLNVDSDSMEVYLNTELSSNKSNRQILLSILSEIHSDYQSSRVLCVNGWIVSNTECQLSRIRSKYVS